MEMPVGYVPTTDQIKDSLDDERLGVFHSCEITHVFLLNKHTKTTIHIFLHATLEQHPATNKHKWITKPPVSLSNDYKVGIVRMTAPVETLFQLIEQFQAGGSVTMPDGQPFTFPRFHQLPWQFISPSLTTTQKPPLTRVLKNSYYVASQVLVLQPEEGIERVWENIPNFKSKLDRCLETVKDEFPIFLSDLPDMLGAIVIQIPITSCSFDITFDRSNNFVTLRTVWNPDVPEERRKGTVLGLAPFDDGLLAAVSLSITGSGETQVPLVTLEHTATLAMIEPRNGIVIGYLPQSNPNRSLKFSMNTTDGTPRILPTTGVGGQLLDVPANLIIHNPRTSIIGGGQNEILAPAKSRRLLQERQQLSNRLKFREFGAGKNERLAALEYVRKIISSDRDTENVWLWDPYIGFDEILEIAFSTNLPKMDIRALGSSQAWKAPTSTQTSCAPAPSQSNLPQGNTFAQWEQAQKAAFQNLARLPGITMEFRCRQMRGWSFHDRFIILPGKTPMAWSVGKSFNSIGTDHHIIQKVAYPEQIAASFDKLWSKLNHPKDVIARYSWS